MSMLKALEGEICERSDGNPGAIAVMSQGVHRYGELFLASLKVRNLRGSAIWQFYKDKCGESIERMMLALGEPVK